MNDTVYTILGVVVVVIAIPITLLWLRDKLEDARFRKENPPEKQAEDRRLYDERILNPDWEFYESHLQRPVPQALRELFADQGLVTSRGLEYSETDEIVGFDALDEEGLKATRPWLGFDAISIATGSCGDPIYLRPGTAEPDTVYITYHDGGDTVVFAESVEAMVKQLRQVNGIS